MPLLALGGLSLLAGLWGGLIRLGWPLPPLAAPLAPGHGPLMVAGFLGTVISLERAVALKQRWTYGAPFLAGVGALSALTKLPAHVPHALVAASGILLVAVFVHLALRHPALHLWVMALAAVLWVAGTALWHLGFAFYRVVPWWAGFLVLTIAGERLELSRLLPASPWGRREFLLGAALLVSGLVVGLDPFAAGVRLSGAGLLGLAFWLLRHDIAWQTLRRPGRPRFMAICLLSGHIWLGVAGILWLTLARGFAAGPYYDAMLHAVFLGFVFSMIFGHALIILPSVLGVALPFRRVFYIHWALLHLSLLLRVGGDLAGWTSAQQWGGLGNAVAVLLFLANSALAVAAGRERPRESH
jgi:hypothetical protein